ncbi:MAG: NADH-quinone oxidoreductase subunit N [Aquihabitans sp.]
MLGSILAAAGDSYGAFTTPVIDWHALAPSLILVATVAASVVFDSLSSERNSGLISSLAGIGFLAALIPVITLALSDSEARVLFDGAFVVDKFSLVLTGLFLFSGYITILLSTNAIAEGDYPEGEYYTLLTAAVLGMVIMTSARDLITIFVAFELLSIPTYLLAAWRKRTQTGVEAGMKYFLIGVFATGVMLYGMSLIYGITGNTILVNIGAQLNGSVGSEPIAIIGIVFVLVGFGFKISAVPFHNWSPDTYEGAPTPVTAFLSVASKAAGFVAILQLVFIAFYGQADIIRPMMFVLAALTMTVGNVIALRQTNIVRLFAYSSVAQAGFILAPLAVVGANADSSANVLSTVIMYLLAYTVLNLGIFAVIISVSRRTGSGEIASWGGLFTYAPGLAVVMALFLFGLGGIPPAVGWIAKFQLFTGVISAGTSAAYAMAVIMAINSVVSLGYYLNVMRVMFMEDAPDGDVSPIKLPVPLIAAIAITAIVAIGLGVYPNFFTDMANGATFAFAAG